MSIPEEYICPISQDLMKNPTLTPNGISYDRDQLVKWICQHGSDPINPKNKLCLNDLVPNLALKAMIENYLKNNTSIAQPPTGLPTEQSTEPPTEPPTELPSNNEDLYNITILPTIKSFENSTIVNLIGCANADRLPVHILAVVDVSGSMGDEVEVKTTTGIERNGLSKLDVTKHALNTMISSMNENDRMTVISFSTSAVLLADAIITNASGKTRLSIIVKNMFPDSQTNIWGELSLALDCVEKIKNSAKSTSIFLLTDGMPNVNPTRGHEYMLTEKLSKMTQKCTINTFGFGYSLDSKLLTNISKIANGLYYFIPEAGFVGTVFINAMANQFLTCAISPTIMLTYKDGSKSVHNLNLCKLGIDRSIFVKHTQKVEKIAITYVNALTHADYVTEYISDNSTEYESDYAIVHSTNLANTSIQSKFFFTLSEENHVQEILNEGIRQDIFKLLENIVTFGVCEQSNTYVNNFINDYIDHNINTYIKNVLEDVTGQVKIAMSNQEYFNKWGRHYLLSLGISHQLQNCSNFKDPGLQLYTSQYFETLRTELDTIFLTLQPPTPSVRLPTNAQSTNARSTTRTSVNMRSYHNSSAPCFSGSCVVQTTSGRKFVKDLKIGDNVLSHYDNFISITHILKTTSTKPNTVVKFDESGLCLTIGHPIYINDTWVSPEDMHGTTFWTTAEDLYDFVLSADHILKINGISCLTLGHNFNTNNLISHAYLGTSAIILDIEKIGNLQHTPCFATINSTNVVRDETGHIVGLSLNEAII